MTNDELSLLVHLCVQREIERVETIFSQGQAIVDRIVAQRKREIADDAAAAVEASRLETRPSFSAASSESDLSELRKLSRDVDDQSGLRVAVLLGYMHSELMFETVSLTAHNELIRDSSHVLYVLLACDFSRRMTSVVRSSALSKSSLRSTLHAPHCRRTKGSCRLKKATRSHRRC